MIKKVLTYSVVIATVVWSVGLLATPFALGAAVSGDLVKKAGSPAVYYLGADSKLHVFTSSADYFSWYTNFSGIKTISDTEFAGYSFGENVFPRPGVKLVQAVDGETPWNIVDPKVYAVSGDGVLRHITSATAAAAIFGANWETQIIPVVISVFTQYTTGSDIAAAADYSKAGEMEDAPDINTVKGLSGTSGVSTGTSLTVALASDTPASGIIIGGTINNKFTKVNLTASADGDIVIDQLVVRRGGTVASDGAFSSIALIDVATGIRIGNTKTLNSEHQAIFNSDITVAAGTTKTIYLAGNMPANTATVSGLAVYAGEIPSLDLYSITLNGGAVIGTVPIVGNYQNLNGTIIPGTLTLYNGSNNPSAATQKIGVTNYLVSGIKLTASSAEDFKVTSITFDQGGTASDADVANLDLLVDDVLVKTVAKPVSGKVTFDLSASPVTVAKGKNVNFDLQLDIVDGSDRTVRFDIEDESDVIAKGQLYGAEVKLACGNVSTTNGCTADAEPFWIAQQVTIDRGALRIGPATLSSTNIPEDADQIVLGKYEFEAKGEEIEITALPIYFLVTTSTGNMLTDATADLTNITVYDEDGKIVSGPDDPALQREEVGATATNYLYGVTSTDTITVSAGVHTYTIKADIDADFGTDDIIVAHIRPDQITAKGSTTGLAVTPTPASEQTSATMTVKTAQLALSVSPTPIARTVVAGTDQHTFANIVLGAESSGEDVKVTKVAVAIKCNATCNPAEVSNWSIYDGSAELSTTNDPDSQTATKVTDDDEATSTFTFSTPLVITRGTSKTLTIKGNISTAATNGTMTVGMADDATTANHITAKGNSTGLDASITLSAADGQGQTFTSTGTVEFGKASATPKEGFIPQNSTGYVVAIFSAEATYEDINIEKIYLTAAAVNSGGLDQLDKVYVYQGATLKAEVTPTSTDAAAAAGDRTILVDMTNTPLVIAKGTSGEITVKVDTPAVDYKTNGDGSGLPSSGQGFQMKINAAGDVTAKGVESGNTLTTGVTITSATANEMTLVRSYPTLTLTSKGTSNTFPAGNSSQDLYKFTVAADSKGDIAVVSFSFRVTTTTATVSDTFLYEGGAKIAGTMPVQGVQGNHGVNQDDIWVFVLTTDGSDPTGDNLAKVMPEQSIISAGSSRTYTLKGTIKCEPINCTGTGNSGSASIEFLGDRESNLRAATSTVIADFTSYPTHTTASMEDVTQNSIMWSDLWRTPTNPTASGTATTCEQWFNGYLVRDNSGNNIESTTTAAIWSKAAQ